MTDRKKKKPVWQMTEEEAVSRYKTDSSRGLSPKEAQKRQGHLKGTPLFGTTEKSLRESLRTMLLDPVLWLLVIIGVLALFFDRAILGWSCIGLAVLNVVVSVILERRAELFDASMQGADMPLSRVVRNGHIMLISAKEVVPGDVLLLHRGDLVSADARLISGNGLRVSDPSIAENNTVHMIERDICSDPLDGDPEKNTMFYANMVNGGGMVIAGSGRAIVTAVGRATHLCAMRGSIQPARHGTFPVGLAIIKHNLSALYIAMVIAIIPLVALAMLTSSAEYGLLDMTLTALALAAVCISRYTIPRMRTVATYMRAATAKQRDTDNAAEIKASGVLDAIDQMTDLVLVGSAALHDGILHPEQIVCGNRTYTVDRATPDEAVLEWTVLFQLAAQPLWNGIAADDERFPDDVPPMSAMRTITRWAEPDMTAWQLCVADAVPYRNGVRITYKDQTVQDVYLSKDPDVIYRSPMFYTEGKRIAATEEDRRSAYALYREAVLAGHHVWFLVSEQEDKACLEGFLTLSYHGCRKTQGYVRDMANAGITVTAFVKETASPEVDRFFTECGLTIGKNAFSGATQEDILTVIRNLQKEGRRVGVLTVEHDDLPILQEADIAFTCSPDSYAGNPGVHTQSDNMTTEGAPNSLRASDLMRRRADVLVRRCSENGGGICGVRNAILCAESYTRHVQRSLCYLLSAQLLRFLFVCFGIGSMPSALTLLISGWVFDGLVLAWYARSFHSQLKRTGAPLTATEALSTSFLSYIPHMIVAAAGTALCWVLLWILQGAVPGILHHVVGQLCIFAALTLIQGVLAIVCYRTKGRSRTVEADDKEEKKD